MFSQSELERDRYENRIKGQRDLMALKRERDDAVRALEDWKRELDDGKRALEDGKRELDVAKRELEDEKRELEDAKRKLAEVERKREEAHLQQDLAQQELVGSGKQNLIGQIRLCQKLLGQSQATCDQLMGESLDRLQALAEQLEQQLTASLG